MSAPILASDTDAVEHRGLITRGLRLVAGYARLHPVVFSVSLAGSLLFAISSVGFTVVLGRLTDDVVLPAFDPDRESTNSVAVFVALAAVAVLRSLGVVTRRFFAGLTNFRLRNDYQRRLASHYLALPYRTLQVLPRGRLVAHTDTDVEQAAEAINPLPFAIGVITILVVGLVSLLVVDVFLMLVVLALLPLLVLLNRLQTRLTAAPELEARRRASEVAGVASESFSGAVVVKTLGRALQEVERFRAVAAGLRDEQIRVAQRRAVFQSLVAVLPDLGVVVLVVVGAERVGSGALSTGELVQAVALFGVLAFPLQVIGYFLGDLVPAVVAAGRLDDLFALPVEQRNGTTPLPPGPLEVAVEDIDVELDGSRLLHGLSLRVEPGEVVALVGATGSGKSMLLHTMAGLWPPAAGTVSVGGIALQDIDPQSRAQRMATAFQEPYLLGDTVAANIAYGSDVDHGDLVRAAQLARVHDVVEALGAGYDTVLGERGVTLSGGQRQRLALARAVLRRPGLLLLDDATSAVDPVTEEAILNALRELDTTIVVVAHRRSTVALADRVVHIADGRVVATGTHEELLRTVPAYASVLQAYGGAEPGLPA